MSTVKSLGSSKKLFAGEYREVDFSTYSAEELRIPLEQIAFRRREIDEFDKTDNSKSTPESISRYKKLLKDVEGRIIARASKIRICTSTHSSANNVCGFCYPNA